MKCRGHYLILTEFVLESPKSYVYNIIIFKSKFDKIHFYLPV